MSQSFTVLKNNVNLITLDTKSIDVKKITHVNESSNVELKFEFNRAKGENYALGVPLNITLINPLNQGDKITINIEFATINSAAIQWLDKEQTLSKEHPFLFTQCEAILCRTLFPCQVNTTI